MNFLPHLFSSISLSLFSKLFFTSEQLIHNKIKKIIHSNPKNIIEINKDLFSKIPFCL